MLQWAGAQPHSVLVLRILLFLLLTTGCAASDTLPDRSAMISRWLDQEPLSTEASPLPRGEFSLGPATYRLGVDPPTDREEFGRIGYGELLAGNQAVVVDVARNRLTLVGADGRVLHLAGGKGGGPGEMEHASGLLRWTDSSVTLLDHQLARVTHYAVVGSELVMDRTEVSTGYLQSVCRSGQTLVGLEYDAATQSVLQVVALNGRPIRSFGLPLVQGSHRLNDVVTQGVVTCLANDAGVVLAAMTGALVRYDSSGILRWRRQMERYFPVEVEEVGGGVLFRYAPPPDNVQTTATTMFQLSARVAMVQLSRLKRLEANGKVELVPGGTETRFFDLESGAELWAQEDVPKVLSLRNGWALLTGDEPEPWIELRPYQLRESMP